MKIKGGHLEEQLGIPTGNPNAVFANKIIKGITFVPLSLWVVLKGFESDQRRLTLLWMRLLVWHDNIRNVRRNLSVLLRHARQANAFTAMLIVSDRIQIASKTTHKDKGTKVNTFYYFINKYNVRVPCGIPILFQSSFYRCSGDFTVKSRVLFPFHWN